MPRYSQIAISLPVDKLFHYSIPAHLSREVRIGVRVIVPFAHRAVVGYVVDLCDEADVKETKEIARVIDDVPILNDEMLSLTRWVSENYFCSWGEAIEAVIPAGLKRGKVSLGSRIKDPEHSVLGPRHTEPHILNAEQARAVRLIVDSMKKSEYKTYLLHGVTASGKTEVYLQAIAEVIKEGKQAIILVPEISLTPQTIEWFASRFGENVAVIHSKLTAARRFLEWKKIKDGSARIVVGARSAIFSPVANLGLIIIDEEHEASYKQDDVPRYHARDVAEERARLNHCPLLLGSATPSLESYYRAKTGTYTLIKLTKRIDERELPRVKIVDMRMELATKKRVTIFSHVLLDAVDGALKNGKQVMIFLNRRGFSTFVHCPKCGFVMKCNKCDTALVYHFDEKKLMCHYCDASMKPPDMCPRCKGERLKYFGLGTEKVESEMSHAFSHVAISRMDSDTTAKRGSHDRILSDFRSGNSRLLVGTQMIAKGHDFPLVTIVGVVSADVSLNIPDFRASERTFDLLTQVAGRAGRGEDGGEVIVQTYAPDNYAIRAAEKHDYERFYNEEIVFRKELGYPPFVQLAKVTVRGRRDDDVLKTAQELANHIRGEASGSSLVAGPTPAPMKRMRGYFRYNILIKNETRAALSTLLKKALATFKKPHGMYIAVDIDPMSM